MDTGDAQSQGLFRAYPTPEWLAIGRLAGAAGAGVETIRCYQQRGLLPVPPSAGAYRQYPVALAVRIRFVKRARELGFSLDEIVEWLRLEDWTHRDSIWRIATDRLGQIAQNWRTCSACAKRSGTWCRNANIRVPIGPVRSSQPPGLLRQPQLEAMVARRK